MKTDFLVGYAEVNINPPLGIGIHGYYVPRYAKGFIDDLFASAISLSKGGKRFLIVSVDNCSISAELTKRCKIAIEKSSGIPASNVFLSATHTHTGPFSAPTTAFEVDEEKINGYVDFLVNRIADLSVIAKNDEKAAKMGYATGYAPDRISYIRRYKMKDGTTQTCPPINDPNIDHPIGELDRRVHILRFDREGANSVVILNYGIHTDTIGGERISSDFCGWMKRTLKAALDGVDSMFIPGIQGDVGSTNVHPLPGDMNDTEISFDNEMKSPGMARFIGRALAGTILQVYDKVSYVDVDDIKTIAKDLAVEANTPTKDELILAKKYKELHDLGRDDLIPFEAMELSTVVAEALRMVKLENAPSHFHLEILGLKLGPVAMIGIPGQPFTPVGVAIKDTLGWDMIMPCSMTNGNDGYFPMLDSYREGGYEARTSSYKAGVSEAIIECSKTILKELGGTKK